MRTIPLAAFTITTLLEILTASTRATPAKKWDLRDES